MRNPLVPTFTDLLLTGLVIGAAILIAATVVVAVVMISRRRSAVSRGVADEAEFER